MLWLVAPAAGLAALFFLLGRWDGSGPRSASGAEPVGEVELGRGSVGLLATAPGTEGSLGEAEAAAEPVALARGQEIPAGAWITTAPKPDSLPSERGMGPGRKIHQPSAAAPHLPESTASDADSASRRAPAMPGAREPHLPSTSGHLPHLTTRSRESSGLAAGDGESSGATPQRQAGLAEAPRDGRGLASVRLASGASVRIGAGSRARLLSDSALVLERGAVYVDAAASSGVEVRTTLGVVRDIGTQFEVRLSAGPEAMLSVRVREGWVELHAGAGEGGEAPRHRAGAGEELRLAAYGSLRRGRVPVHGQVWNWVLASAAAPEVEGKSLRSFLDWLVREGGWELRFAEPAAAELATTTVIHGEVTGLDAAQATAIVFESSGFTFDLENGVFLVSSPPPDPSPAP
ncbi:MAG: FecR family protein [Holophagales bacterium]|nr:FecR family protein [Holophagales bacterium]